MISLCKGVKRGTRLTLLDYLELKPTDSFPPLQVLRDPQAPFRNIRIVYVKTRNWPGVSKIGKMSMALRLIDMDSFQFRVPNLGLERPLV
jgi:hypothetical protein